jgi:hypothetical protein
MLPYVVPACSGYLHCRNLSDLPTVENGEIDLQLLTAFIEIRMRWLFYAMFPLLQPLSTPMRLQLVQFLRNNGDRSQRNRHPRRIQALTRYGMI